MGNIYPFGTNSDFFGTARVQKNKTAAQKISRQGRRLCPQCSKAERTVLHTGFSRVQNRYWVPLPVTHEQDNNQLFSPEIRTEKKKVTVIIEQKSAGLSLKKMKMLRHHTMIIRKEIVIKKQDDKIGRYGQEWMHFMEVHHQEQAQQMKQAGTFEAKAQAVHFDWLHPLGRHYGDLRLDFKRSHCRAFPSFR